MNKNLDIRQKPLENLGDPVECRVSKLVLFVNFWKKLDTSTFSLDIISRLLSRLAGVVSDLIVCISKSDLMSCSFNILQKFVWLNIVKFELLGHVFVLQKIQTRINLYSWCYFSMTFWTFGSYIGKGRKICELKSERDLYESNLRLKIRTWKIAEKEIARIDKELAELTNSNS